MMMIGGRAVGRGAPVFVIAEAGVNHDGDIAKARALVDAAADAGADAVKFQTFDADSLATAGAPKAAYQEDGTEESQLEMLRRLELSEEAHQTLKAHAESRSVLFLSTPFDLSSVEMLERLGVAAIKVGSGETTDLPLLRRIAATGRPVIHSTGMADLEEVTAAVQTYREAGCTELALLHSVSMYPADPDDVNLRAMATLAETFDVPVGFSDHTLGTLVTVAAVAAGACIVEKHLTLDRGGRGPDHHASIESADFAAMVRDIRQVERALGDGVKAPVAGEADIARVARKSVVVVRDIAQGAEITREALDVLRASGGISPARLETVLGKRARERIIAGTTLHEDMLA